MGTGSNEMIPVIKAGGTRYTIGMKDTFINVNNNAKHTGEIVQMHLTAQKQLILTLKTPHGLRTIRVH